METARAHEEPGEVLFIPKKHLTLEEGRMELVHAGVGVGGSGSEAPFKLRAVRVSGCFCRFGLYGGNTATSEHSDKGAGGNPVPGCTSVHQCPSSQRGN